MKQLLSLIIFILAGLLVQYTSANIIHNNINPRKCNDKGMVIERNYWHLKENISIKKLSYPFCNRIQCHILFFSPSATSSQRYLPGLKYSNFKVFRVQAPSNLTSSWEQFDFHNFVPWNEQSRASNHVDILVRPDNVETATKRLKENNLTYSILIDDVGELFSTSVMSRMLLSPINKEGHRMTWDAYHSNEDIENYLEYLVNNHSDILSLEDIGKSYEGRPMKVLKICKGGCGLKPAMWIDGGIHAREWISPATVTYLIRKLLEVRYEDSFIDLVDKLDWYFLPILNPDGTKQPHSCK